ncbi:MULTISPECIES: SMP-30/gluconolactonase/LRE family protein [Flavobacteriaceae]|uniref:SMP-30/gluconolactonase/LRE family protein n=1 Tax=Flavobacteriaceae TaxID=49546 RepID=UPI001492BFD6|nr:MULTISPECIES: SMP-30/gluconolactonase/LRE family protein [Allomuricauda]MDC6364769.1 SMP-30/gluconolactonase/LRE family protein [Muricauda sp. AC10]
MRLNNIFLAILFCLICHIGLLAQQKTIGKLVAEDAAFYELIDANAEIEVLADGFTWTEGPVWNKKEDFILFSDVPENTIYKWSEKDSLSIFLKPSGYTGILPYSSEPGSNGLLINTDGELVACEHGDRRVTIMPMDGTGGKFTLADNWEGKRFNSPNDVVQASNGTYYFTDPPYGMPGRENSAIREIDAHGVYMIASDGSVEMVVSNLTRPNGITLSPDGKKLYVAQSDPNAAFIMEYSVQANGSLDEGKLFFDATPLAKSGLKGLPDGIKVDRNGTIFSTGPGGVLVISKTGKLLGRIETGVPTANCNWGEDGSVLYITADMYLARIQTKTIGFGF